MRKHNPPRDLRTLPPEAFVSVREIVAPHGPAPVGQTKFWAMVKSGEAPQPVRFGTHCTRWRWGEIQQWLNGLGG